MAICDREKELRVVGEAAHVARPQKVQEGNERVVKAVEELKKAEMRTLRDKE